MTMFVFGELVIETICCGRQLPISQTVCTVWSVGTVAWHSFRCKDRDECEALELAEVSQPAAPFAKVLAN